MALSKNQIKLIASLSQKKYRQKHNLFIAEGVKVVNEFLKSYLEIDALYCTADFNTTAIHTNINVITEVELKKISSLKTPNKVLGIFKIPTQHAPKINGLTLALDTINDPGNLGTIIRLCDWFGVQQLLCSKDTVDCYNTKVVQASMGSLTRVAINYVDLNTFLNNTETPTYIADMAGNNVYKTTLKENAILVMGNEANGVSKPIRDLVKNSISIPRFGNTQNTESLNVATATAILLSEFKRR